MKNQIDIVKEKRDLKILEIIRNVLLFIAFLLGVIIFCLESKASPMRDDTVSANVTIKVVKDYIDNKTAQNGASGNVLIDYGDAILNGIDSLKSMLPSEIRAFVGPAAYATPIYTSEFIEAYDNNDLSYFIATFDIQNTIDLSNMDDYLSQQSDYIINNIQSDVIAYYPINIDDVSSFSGGYPNISHTISRMIGENFFNHDLYPCFFYRTWDSWGSYSLKSVNGGQDCKGYVLTNVYLGDWNFFVNNFDYIRKNGFIPKEYDYRYALNFQCYGDNGPYPGGGINNNKIGSENFNNLIIFDDYDYYSSEGTTRHQTAIFTNSDNLGIPVLFFRNSAAFEKFYNGNSRFAIPYDFNIEFPDTDFSSLDFSKILNAIRESNVLESQNLQELYNHLNQTISQGIQDIIDGQKTTNELMLALLRYYDNNIVKTGENITDILLDINESIKNISSPSDEEISSYLDTIIQDPSLENRLKHIFPFGVFQDVKDLTDLLDQVTVLEPRWDFRLNVGLFEEKYIDYSIDLTTVPEIDTFRSFWFFFILLSFNLLCLGIEYKFLCMFMGGGD